MCVCVGGGGGAGCAGAGRMCFEQACTQGWGSRTGLTWVQPMDVGALDWGRSFIQLVPSHQETAPPRRPHIACLPPLTRVAHEQVDVLHYVHVYFVVFVHDVPPPPADGACDRHGGVAGCYSAGGLGEAQREGVAEQGSVVREELRLWCGLRVGEGYGIEQSCI